MPSRITERINFGKIKEIVVPPNMIELQTNSYAEFLQAAASPNRRQKDTGLEAVFREVFPIKSYDEKCELDYKSYEIGEPKVDWLECLREGLTYGAPLYVTFLLKEEGKSAKEEKVFMGELPLMTPQGTFVINGAERVVVSASCIARPASPLKPPSIRTAKCCTVSASFPTAAPGTRRNLTRATCCMFISTAKNAAGNF